MARNIEIKARIPTSRRDAIRSCAAALAAGPPVVVCQTDTYFNVQTGRLKLRMVPGEDAELIFYERADESGPKPSSYVRSPVGSPETLRDALAQALGIRGVVEKRREVFLVDQTRVHLDDVQSLGTFIELEVVLREGESEAEGRAIANRLLIELEIRPEWLVSGSYIDLIEGGAACSGGRRRPAGRRQPKLRGSR